MPKLELCRWKWDGGENITFLLFLINDPSLVSVSQKWACESISDYKGQVNVISFYETFMQGVCACPLSFLLIVIIKICVKLPKAHGKKIAKWEAWVQSGNH